MSIAAPVRAPARVPPPAAALGDDAVDGALKLALRLAGGDAYARPLDFGDLELPPATGGTVDDQRRLRAVAPLYLAGELESTRLLAAVEALAGLAATGGLPGDPGPAEEKLLAFRHRAHERLTAGERDALFGRLFGKPYGPALAAHDAHGARNEEFEGLMIDLADALSRPAAPGPADVPGGGSVGAAAPPRALADNLLLRSGGIAEYAASDVLEAIRDALAILKVPQLQAAFGQTSVWTTVAEVARRYLHQQTDLVSRVARGRAGTTLLAWLAEVLPAVGDLSVALAPPGGPLADAAVAWLQASLVLHEGAAPPRSGAAA